MRFESAVEDDYQNGTSCRGLLEGEYAGVTSTKLKDLHQGEKMRNKVR